MSIYLIHRLAAVGLGYDRDLGFEVDEVRELLMLVDRPDDPCGSVDVIARRQVARIDAKMKCLRAVRRELMMVIKACHSARGRDCLIIEALSAPSPTR